MTDYQNLKVPELKKLLTERSLPQTGNKADLIARLQENDKEKSAAEAPGKLNDRCLRASIRSLFASVLARLDTAPTFLPDAFQFSTTKLA